jgi:hypothetical protein
MPEFLWDAEISMECLNFYGIPEFLWNAGDFYGMPEFPQNAPEFPRMLEFLLCVQLSSASFAH